MDRTETQAAVRPGLDGLDDAQVRPSVAEDRAVARGRARGAREEARRLRERVSGSRHEATEATEIAVAALAEADGLRRAMHSRGQIEMAKGILIERHKISEDEAFRMLVAASQRGQVKLVEVARALVEKTIAAADG